jgi:hypothetical protein
MLLCSMMYEPLLGAIDAFQKPAAMQSTHVFEAATTKNST